MTFLYADNRDAQRTDFLDLLTPGSSRRGAIVLFDRRERCHPAPNNGQQPQDRSWGIPTAVFDGRERQWGIPIILSDWL